MVFRNSYSGIILMFLLLFSVIRCPAQEENSIIKLTYISAGAAFHVPSGCFASSSGQYAGYAKNGIGFFLESALYLRYSIGAGVKLGLYSCRTRDSAIQNYYTSYYESNGYPGKSELFATPWNIGQVMAGLYYSKTYKRYTVDLKFLAGSLSGESPYISYSMISGSDTLLMRQNARFGRSLGIDAGAGLRVNVFRNFSVKTDFDYLRGMPEMNYYSSGSKPENTDYTTVIRFVSRQPVSLFSFSFGVVLKLSCSSRTSE